MWAPSLFLLLLAPACAPVESPTLVVCSEHSHCPAGDDPVWYCDVQPGEETGFCTDDGGNVDHDGDGDSLAEGDCDDNDPEIGPSRDEQLCDGVDNDCQVDTADRPDLDADGVTACDGDCDDEDATVNPKATEACNGVDDDCSGALESDEVDGDEDSFLGCADCDDEAGAVHPGATEACNGVDDDCSGAPGADEVDADGDSVLACADCDDEDEDNFPDNVEVCDDQDNDCDGAPSGDEIDDDGDGQSECEGDCDDADAGISPSELEMGCDTIDNDCDPSTPDLLDSDGDGSDCDQDCDDDDPSRSPTLAEVCDDGTDNDCDALSGDVFDADSDGAACNIDCDDSDGAVQPGAVEICNLGVDDDCDPSTDEDHDGDSDGFSEICGGDCDDQDPANFPGNFEVCDERDNDCDGVLGGDEIDDDGDGVSECAGDCDDGNAVRFPSNPEFCDGIDNDCLNGVPGDELDGDGDGFSECAGDCDDGQPTQFPDNPELCDGLDNDCRSGLPGPDGLDLRLSEEDSDGDGLLDCSDCHPNAPGGSEADCVLAVAGGRLFGAVPSASLGVKVRALFEGTDDAASALLLGANRPTGRDEVVYRFGLPLVGSLGPEDASAVWSGTLGAGGDTVLAVVDDLTGDGLADVLVGLDGEEAGDGQAYLVSGAAGSGTLTGAFDNVALVTFRASSGQGGAFGAGVASGYLLGNDAVPDLLLGGHHMGQPSATPPLAGTSNVGVLYVVDGTLAQGPYPTDVSLPDDASAAFYGASDSDRVGTPQLDAMDFDCDGELDLVIESSSWDLDRGAVYVVFGPIPTGPQLLDDLVAGPPGSALRLSGVSASDKLGEELAAWPDISGDGCPELVLSAQHGSGQGGITYLVLSGAGHSSGSIANAAHLTLNGAAAERSGSWLAPAGDATGDGINDFFVGAPTNSTDEGRVYLISGADVCPVPQSSCPALGSQALASFATSSLVGSDSYRGALGMSGAWIGTSALGTDDSIIGSHQAGDGTDLDLGAFYTVAGSAW